jgi:hypothetical protein
MEDVLDVYCQPYDPTVPRICRDEMGKNLVQEKHSSEPAKPGQVAREDYTYEKQGRANLFIAYEPLADKRYLKATEQRTKQDWALFMQEVLEEHYPEARSHKICQVPRKKLGGQPEPKDKQYPLSSKLII